MRKDKSKRIKPNIFRLIRKLIRKENPIILEIGANTGRDTKRFLKKFKNISLYCFEPDPRCIRKFKKNIDDNRCELYEVAISDHDSSKCDFHLSGGSRPGHSSTHINSSSLHRPKHHLIKHPSITFNETIQVKTMRLDSWFQCLCPSTIDFVWADIQGAEKQLILGGRKTLKHTRYLYTEFSNEERYANQINLKEILKLLPTYKIHESYLGCSDYSTNILLKNERKK